MAPPPEDDHECGWKAFAKDLVEKMAELEAKMAAMERRLLGPKSEKQPPMDREVRKQRPADPAATQEMRRKNAELRATRVETETVEHKVPESDRTCPKCNGTKLRAVGLGKESIVVDYVPGYFRRRRHVRETLACPCGQHMVVAPGPDHSIEGARYGDGFRAFVVTSKCADSIPLYRQARQLSRLGIPIARSTLTDLLHQVARSLEPLAQRLLKLVAAAEVVQADETSLKMQKPNKRGFVWTFLADKLIAYRFAGNRSGATPESVLGAGPGTLVVDMFTGYNVVTGTGKRDRAGCLAHVRRRFFDALPYAPEGKIALEFIRDVYVVEHDAIAAGLAGTEEHRRMRQARTGPIMARLMTWLEAQKHLHPPKGPMGSAVAYTLNHWTELTRFIENPDIPPDNNRSESALRVVALGRKNFLFVGHEQAGQNLADLYSLVATCMANGKDPLAYLTDILGRIGSHPAARLDDLLPQNWSPPG
ncbi:MAG: IS66 family transposase [Myxococcales bacterium]